MKRDRSFTASETQRNAEVHTLRDPFRHGRCKNKHGVKLCDHWRRTYWGSSLQRTLGGSGPPQADNLKVWVTQGHLPTGWILDQPQYASLRSTIHTHQQDWVSPVNCNLPAPNQMSALGVLLWMLQTEEEERNCQVYVLGLNIPFMVSQSDNLLVFLDYMIVGS